MMSEHARGRASRGRTGPLYILLGAGLIALGVVAAVVVSAIGGDDGDDDGALLVTSAEIALPAGWATVALSDADAAAGVLIRGERTEPEATLLVRSVAGRLPADFDIDALANETEAALLAESEGATVTSGGVGQEGGVEAVHLSYTQSDGSHSFMAIMPTANQTFYIVVRATEADYLDVEVDAQDIVRRFGAFVKDST